MPASWAAFTGSDALCACIVAGESSTRESSVVAAHFSVNGLQWIPMERGDVLISHKSQERAQLLAEISCNELQ